MPGVVSELTVTTSSRMLDYEMQALAAKSLGSPQVKLLEMHAGCPKKDKITCLLKAKFKVQCHFFFYWDILLTKKFAIIKGDKRVIFLGPCCSCSCCNY